MGWDRGLLESFRAFGTGLGGAPDFSKITAPVLVIHGSRDSTVQIAQGRAVAAAFRSSRGGDGRGPAAAVKFVELQGCGHLPMEEQPEEFIKAVVKFVAAHCMVG